MTAMGMSSMYMMSQQASAGSMDASASHTHCAFAHAAFRTVINRLDAIILASIFVISIVSLGGLSISLVLLVNLVCLLIYCRSTRPKRKRRVP